MTDAERADLQSTLICATIRMLSHWERGVCFIGHRELHSAGHNAPHKRTKRPAIDSA